MFCILSSSFGSSHLATAHANRKTIPLSHFWRWLALILCWGSTSAYAYTPTTAFNPMDVVVPSTDPLASLIFGLFMGVMLSASAYLFFIWIVIRDRGQIFLMFFLICLAINIASTNELLMSQVGLNSNTQRLLLSNNSMIFSSILGVVFTYYFLEIDINNPELKLPLFILAGLLLLLLLYSVVDQELAHFALPTVNTLTISVILVAGVISLRQGISGSFTHIIAFLFFLTGALAEPLYDLGLISSMHSTNNLTYISFSMSALMFAIVIAGQFATRQEEKEKALATSNERFTLATRGANEGLFDWNLKAHEVFFSDQFRKILGSRLDNNHNSLKIWLRLIAPTDRRIVREALRRFRHNPDINSINVEYRITQANEKKHWLQSKVVALRDPQSKKIIRLVGSTNDITLRKQNEVALRASEARFRSITEAHPVPVLIAGLRTGNVLYASPGAEELLGLSQNDLVNVSLERFFTTDQVRRDLFSAMEERKAINLLEVQLIRGSGAKIDTALSARRISYQNEEAMVIGLYDMTDQKQAEAQIAQQQEALQQSEKMAALGGLLAGVAHELNNPLSVVVGQATLLMEGSTEPKVITRAEKIYKAADRCSRIVKSFLALARRKPPEHKQVKLNEVIESALELLGYQIRTNDIQVLLELDKNLPSVIGDGDQLIQVITNLVLNAAQAMDGWMGPKKITIGSFTLNDKVMIKVSDTGPGIPQELRARVFEPFFTTKGNKGGTGVGLALCLNIVASHGGNVALEDTVGGGATFIISIPMMTQATVSPSSQPKESVLLPSNLKILIVDDEVELAQTLCDLLEPEGHYIDLAANGSIALDKLRKSPFDLIISDLRMPVMDGPALYEALAKERPSYLDKIIYVTGDTLSTHVQSFLNEHPVNLVEKPYRLVDVRRAMATTLQHASQKNAVTPVVSTSIKQST